MKIMYKLMAGFLALVMLFSIAGIVIVSNLQVIETVDAQVSSDFAINQYATNYERGARKLQVGAYLYSQDSHAMGRQLIEEGKALMAENRENLKMASLSQGLGKELVEIERLEYLSIEATDGVVERVTNPDTDSIKQQNQLQLDLHFLEARIEALNLKLGIFVDKTQEDMTSSLKLAEESGKKTVNVTVTAILASIIIALMVSIFSAKMITDPVKYLTDVANRVSKGDISEKIEVSSSDEIGELASSFKRMINAFKVMEAMTREEADK